MNDLKEFKDITPPLYPKFMFTVDHQQEELYILCTHPFALIWVRPTMPEEFYIIKGEHDAEMLDECIFWYKRNNKIMHH